MYIKRIHRMMELLFKIQTDASPDYLKDFILLKKLILTYVMKMS